MARNDRWYGSCRSNLWFTANARCLFATSPTPSAELNLNGENDSDRIAALAPPSAWRNATMPTPNAPPPGASPATAWQWLAAHLPADWGTWVAVVVLVALGLAQLPHANSAGHKPAPAPVDSPIDPNCPTLEPQTAGNNPATKPQTTTASATPIATPIALPIATAEATAKNATAKTAETSAQDLAAVTAEPAADNHSRLQDWRYARGKWIRLTEERGIPAQPANFVQRISPLLWAALLWLAATWILVASA